LEPVRYFAFIDLSGRLGEAVDQALEEHYQRRVFDAFQTYVGRNLASGETLSNAGAGLDPESISADVLDKAEEMKEKGFEAFRAAGGWKPYLATLEASDVLKEDRDPFVPPERKLVRVDRVPGLDPVGSDFATLSQSLKAILRNQTKVPIPGGKEEVLFAGVLIPRDILAPRGDSILDKMGLRKTPKVEYWAANQADKDLLDLIRNALNQKLREQRFTERGMDKAEVERIQKLVVPVVAKDPKKSAGKETVSTADLVRQWAPAGFTYLLWAALMGVVQMLLNNTIEEKSNRIVEVLLSSVTAGELMAGKLLGIASVGFTMVLAWFGALVGVLVWQAGPEAEIATQLLGVIRHSGLLLPFLFYFLVAYLLYAGIFLAIGSVCNTLKEAQNFMGPVMLVMMVPLLTMMFIPKDPNGTLAVVLSWIPLYTPFVMMNRAAADPPLFDVIGTTILSIVSVIVMIWLSGKIFRAAILRTGQPPRILEMLRWLRRTD